jgi:hypothetical protein
MYRPGFARVSLVEVWKYEQGYEFKIGEVVLGGYEGSLLRIGKSEGVRHWDVLYVNSITHKLAEKLRWWWYDRQEAKIREQVAQMTAVELAAKEERYKLYCSHLELQENVRWVGPELQEFNKRWLREHSKEMKR